ncbi:MAG: AI-2E family transporter [Oscillospiraceae bacterium]|nr:AI-2E family transporter [Oscillospiraceae bacterium]
MKEWRRYGKWALTAFITVCAILVFYDTFYQSGALGELLQKTTKILAPVLYGMALAYLLSSVVNRVEQMMLPGINKLCARRQMAAVKVGAPWLRAVSILLTWSLVLLMLYLLMSVLVPQLIESVKTLIANAENYYNTIYGWGNELLKDNPKVALRLQQLLEDYRESADGFLSGLVPKLENLVLSVTDGIWSGVWGVVNFAMDLVIGIIISVYLLATKEKSLARTYKGIYSLLREDRAAALIRGTRKVDAIFSGFIRGKLLDSLIIGILCFIGCSILKMPYTPLISVVVGVTNVIPFFGPFLGAIPSIFLILLVNPLKAVYFALFVLALQQLDGNVIGPKILGDSTGISSFWVIVSILVGGGFFGVLGMFLAVPVFAALQTLAKYLVNRQLRRRGMPLDAKHYVNLNKEVQPAGKEPEQEGETNNE